MSAAGSRKPNPQRRKETRKTYILRNSARARATTGRAWRRRAAMRMWWSRAIERSGIPGRGPTGLCVRKQARSGRGLEGGTAPVCLASACLCDAVRSTDGRPHLTYFQHTTRPTRPARPARPARPPAPIHLVCHQLASSAPYVQTLCSGRRQLAQGCCLLCDVMFVIVFLRG